MVTDSSSTLSLAPEAASGPALRAEVQGIDVSARAPVLCLFGSSILWLLVSCALGLMAAWKLQTPGFLNDCAFLTYGRVQPAQSNALVYGWGVNAALGVALWLMARLSRGTLPGTGALVAAIGFWNFGVTLGVVGILAYGPASVQWLEMPGFAGPVLFVAYAFIAAWAVLAFRGGRAGSLYVSQWYLFAALFCFPWIFSTAEILLVLVPVRGSLQAVIDSWFMGNLLLLWFLGIAIATLYYFLPKLLLRPVYHYELARLAFWWFVFFGSLAGTGRLLGGPVPAWVQSVGAVASLMLLVPLVILSLNLWGTLRGSGGSAFKNPTIGFLTCSLLGLTLALVGWFLGAFHPVAAITQFTLAAEGHLQVTLIGGFSFAAFGAMYYIVPRLAGVEWVSNRMVGVHFWSSVLGGGLSIAALILGGFAQGFDLADPKIAFADVSAHVHSYLVVAALGGVLFAIGQVAFAVNFFSTLGRAGAACCGCTGAMKGEAAR